MRNGTGQEFAKVLKNGVAGKQNGEQTMTKKEKKNKASAWTREE